MFGDTIQNNTLDGINLTLGSGVLLDLPAVTVTNNLQFGLRCFDGSSRLGAANADALAGIHDNVQGQISCTGF